MGAAIGLGTLALNQLQREDDEQQEETTLLSSLMDVVSGNTSEVYAAETLPIEGILYSISYSISLSLFGAGFGSGSLLYSFH